MKIFFYNSSMDLFLESEVLVLYKIAEWWGEESEKDHFYIKKILENSFPFVGLFEDNRLIGMGRAISDKVSDAYIQDIFVLEEFRGKGLGKLIVENIVEFLKNNDISWIGLIAKPGKNVFYEKSGFKIMKDFFPLLYEEE